MEMDTLKRNKKASYQRAYLEGIKRRKNEALTSVAHGMSTSIATNNQKIKLKTSSIDKIAKISSRETRKVVLLSVEYITVVHHEFNLNKL